MSEDESTNQNPSASEYRLWVNQGADEAPATIITVHLPVPAAPLPPSGPRSRLKTILTCIQTNNRNKYNKTKLKRK